MIKEIVSPKASITDSKLVMDDFMEKLNDGTLTQDKEPTIDEYLTLDDDFIDEQVERYTKLLKSHIVEESIDVKVKNHKISKKNG